MQNPEKNNQDILLHLFEVEELEARLENRHWTDSEGIFKDIEEGKDPEITG